MLLVHVLVFHLIQDSLYSILQNTFVEAKQIWICNALISQHSFFGWQENVNV